MLVLFWDLVREEGSVGCIPAKAVLACIGPGSDIVLGVCHIIDADAGGGEVFEEFSP